ncbi:MAG TPA: geranylgeranyl reductase family protein [Burkholderiales bacterium]|nr:geranylgeranyl reductase family protein [Burkholderiales bacterium]
MRYDAIVVGAGPAGSYAAYLLAKQGVAVALLDRVAFPREKPCGGALSRKALDLVRLDLSPVIHGHVTGAWLAHGERAVFCDTRGVAAGMTLRTELDAFLLEHAVKAGARFHPETSFLDVETNGGEVRVATSRGELTGRLLLAADGVASAVRRRVFGADVVEYAPAAEALVHASPAIVARFGDRVLLDLAGMPGGYGWIFGKRDHLNVGVYSIGGRGGIRGHLAAFLARHPSLGRADRIRYLGHPIPVANRARRFERGPVWLLGDAAGLAECILGEGIYFALKSATLAARAFLAPAVRAYTRLLEDEVLPELAAAEHLARACYAHPRFLFERIARSRYASRLFLGVVTGEVGYRQCLLGSLATVPRWLLSARADVAALTV